MYPVPNSNPYGYQPYNTQVFNPYPQPQQPKFFTQPVGSFDEVKGYPVDPNIGYLFPDTGNGRIYFKQLNMQTGKSEITVYAPVEDAKPEDFNSMVTRRLDSIEKTLGGLHESISGLSERGKDHKEPAGSNATETAQ